MTYKEIASNIVEWTKDSADMPTQARVEFSFIIEISNPEGFGRLKELETLDYLKIKELKKSAIPLKLNCKTTFNAVSKPETDECIQPGNSDSGK